MQSARRSGSGVRPRGRPVGADSEQTRRAILSAAREVIVEVGYPATTFQQIAMRAGVSRPTLHYYFGTREQIYDILLREVLEQVGGCIRGARQQSGLRGQLAAFVTAIQRFGAENPASLKLLVTARLEQRRGSLRHDTAHLVVCAVHGFYDAIVAEAARRGELETGADIGAVAHMLASVFWGMCLHTTLLDRRDHGDDDGDDGDGDRDSVAQLLIRVFETGLLNKPSRDLSGRIIRTRRDTHRDTLGGVGGQS